MNRKLKTAFCGCVSALMITTTACRDKENDSTMDTISSSPYNPSGASSDSSNSGSSDNSGNNDNSGRPNGSSAASATMNSRSSTKLDTANSAMQRRPSNQR